MLDLAEAYAAAEGDGVRLERRAGPRLIRLSGPQRVWFLQNTITADVDGVEDGRWVESCFLDPKGRVVAHFRVGFLGDDVWIDADPLSGAALGEWFVKYKFRTKVEIEPVRVPCVTYFGGSDSLPDGAVAARDGGVAFGRTLVGVAVTDVYGGAPPAGPGEAPPELYDVLRIEAGVGEFGVDFGPTDLPQEAGLTRVLSVEKGCYVGQETIARIHFRGHVNRVLRTLELAGVDTSLAVDRQLFVDGAPVGRVTSAATSPRRGPVGIGMVRVEPEAGSLLVVEGGGEAIVGPVPEGTKVKR